MISFGLGTFFSFGVLLVIVGAYQPSLAAALSLDIAQTGMLGAAAMLGIAAGVILAGPAVDRLPARPLFVAACAITAAALLGVDGEMSVARALFHMLLFGVGGGFYETVLNTRAVALYGEDSVRRLSLLHAAATAGAMSTPLLVQWAAPDDFVVGFRAAGALHVLLACWAAFTIALGGVRAAAHSATAPRAIDVDVPRSISTVLRNPVILALLAGALFYIGVEASISLFAVPYAQGALGLDVARGRSAISAFWFGLLIMRILILFSPTNPGARLIVVSGLFATATLGVATALGLPWIEMVLAATGFSLGALFPMLVALSGLAEPRARGTAIAVVAGIGSLGGFIWPWGLGLIGEAFGIRAVFGAIALSCAAVAAAGLVAHKFIQRFDSVRDHVGAPAILE